MEKVRDYVGQIFLGLADIAVEEPGRSFQSLAAEHATLGGINEQVLSYLVQHRVFESVNEALDAVLERFRSKSQEH
jgi:pyrroline-5-carboxylate reductase